MTDLADVSSGDIITSARQNLINDYVQDGTHKINTLSIDVGGTEIIDSIREHKIDVTINKTSPSVVLKDTSTATIVYDNVSESIDFVFS